MRALWSDRQNCSHNVSRKVKRIRRLSEALLPLSEPCGSCNEYLHNRSLINFWYFLLMFGLTWSRLVGMLLSWISSTSLPRLFCCPSVFCALALALLLSYLGIVLPSFHNGFHLRCFLGEATSPLDRLESCSFLVFLSHDHGEKS